MGSDCLMARLDRRAGKLEIINHWYRQKIDEGFALTQDVKM
jgi:hypothetical protein